MKRKQYIGVDLGGTNVRAGLVTEDRIVKIHAQTVRAQGSEREVFEDLCHSIEAVNVGRIGGIGVGVPSVVDLKGGVIIDTTNIPSWKDVPLKKKLEKKFGVPVEINNDANCFALGERYFGFGRKCDNFVGLIIGTGLGAGVISRGRLHSGMDCGAGEFGLIPYNESIVEHYASGQFFNKFGSDGATLATAAAAGDREAQARFDEYGHHLAFAVKVILYSLAPEMIVLGGSVSQAYTLFEKSLHNSLADFAYPTIAKKLKLKISKLKNIAVLGAASLVKDQVV